MADPQPVVGPEARAGAVTAATAATVLAVEPDRTGQYERRRGGPLHA